MVPLISTFQKPISPIRRKQTERTELSRQTVNFLPSQRMICDNPTSMRTSVTQQGDARLQNGLIPQAILGIFVRPCQNFWLPSCSSRRRHETYSSFRHSHSHRDLLRCGLLRCPASDASANIHAGSFGDFCKRIIRLLPLVP